MKHTHTPGPWIVHTQGNTLCQDGAPISGFVCGLNDVAPANVLLLKAAPNLLALLIESQDSIGGDWRQRRDAAIKEATGRRPLSEWEQSRDEFK
jgi:hypothetical protein